MKVIVTCSSTMGIPSGLMFSSGLAILSRVSASSSLPPQELSTAVEASAAPETSALRRVMGRMVIVSFHRDYRMGSWRSRRVRSADGGYGEHSGRRRSEEHTSELQSRGHLVCRLLLEKKKKTTTQELYQSEPSPI